MQTRPNGIEVPTNSDDYKLTTDLANMADKAKVLISVPDAATRDGLAGAWPGGALPIPTHVYRTDVDAIETWDGVKWTGYFDQDLVLTNSGGTTFVNSIGGDPLNVTVRQGVATISGMVSRTLGTGTTVANIPTGARPRKNIRQSFVGINSGNTDGPRGYYFVGVDGALAITKTSDSPAWNTSSWLPINFSYPVAS